MRVRAVFGVAVAGLFAGARPADAHPAFDWVGVELSPIALNAGTPRANSNIHAEPNRFSVTPALTLRVGQHRWSSWYWTPGQLTFAYAGHGAHDESDPPITLVALQTEAGVILHLGARTVLEGGLAAGLGGLDIEVAFACDAACTLGGWPVIAAPVVRVARRWEDFWLKSAGLFARAAVPLQTKSLGGPNVGFGVLFLFGVDLAFGAPAR